MYTAISLFCGAGGLDIGFSKAGFKTIWANDSNKDACATFKLWNPSCEVVCSNINKVDISTIPANDIILGGFPCQGFSLAGPRKLDDERNILYRYYVNIVREKQPKVFIGENVKGILTLGQGEIFDLIVEEFSNCGYNVLYKLLNAKDFNVPENRQRVILVGIRKDLDFSKFSFPIESNKIVNLREALESISEPAEEDVCLESFSPRYMSRNRKKNWNDVSFTIPATAKQVPLHPSSPDMIKIDNDHWEFGEGLTRRFSWRECALIQTFPAQMNFVGNLNSKYKQIGNAVPCNLAYAIGKQIKCFLDSER